VIDLLGLVYGASRAILALAAVLILLRAWRGPSVFDRALAIESLAMAVVGILLLAAYTPEGRLYADAALGLSLFSFVGVVLLGYLLGKGDFSDE